MLTNNSNYNCYYLHIKNKKPRLIQEPFIDLKIQQKNLVEKLNSFPFFFACTSRKGLNLLDNASPHYNAQYLLKIDILNCFPSISLSLVSNSIKKYYNSQYLEEVKQLGFIENNNKILVLPTGAPSSPILCNIALTQLDENILKLIQDKKINYTRYIDDLTFSLQEKNLTLKDQIFDLLLSYGLKPNFKKSKWYSRQKADKFIVTGVNLKGQNRLPRSFSRILRAKLANLAKQKQPLDAEANGCLAYVKLIDFNKYQYFLKYYNQRMQYESIASRISSSS